MTQELIRPDYATLHHYLDAIVAEFIDKTQKLPSRTTIMELLEWTNTQQHAQDTHDHANTRRNSPTA